MLPGLLMYGRCAGAQPAPFADLREALAWVAAGLGLDVAWAVDAALAPAGEAGRTNGAGRQG